MVRLTKRKKEYIKSLKGSGILLAILKKIYFSLIKKWGTDRWKMRQDQVDEIKRLEQKIKKMEGKGQCCGGKLTGEEARNILKRLKSKVEKIKSERRCRGGKFTGKDAVDIVMGPWGWLALGLRKKREREIQRLKEKLKGKGVSASTFSNYKFLKNLYK